MTRLIEFEVLGLPAPQGSARAFMANGRAHLTNAKTPKHNAWRDSVAQAARDVAEHDDVTAPLDGALNLSIEFRFPMPKSRPKRVRDAGSAMKTSAPDLDKLVRSVCDALVAGGLIADDARIAWLCANKTEVVGWTGAVIKLSGSGVA